MIEHNNPNRRQFESRDIILWRYLGLTLDECDVVSVPSEVEDVRIFLVVHYYYLIIFISW